MRLQFFLILFFICLKSHSQIPIELSDYFYRIALKKEPELVKVMLVGDNRFVSYTDSDTSQFSYTRNRTFYGKIIASNLISLSRQNINIDSATIEFTFGIVSNEGSPKKSKSYAGYTKILNLEYFGDSIATENILSHLCDSFTQLFKSITTTDYESSCLSYFEKGKHWTFQNTRNKLIEFTISRKKYNTQAFSLRLSITVNQ